jgi:ElaB/YqjD/DUF883 family membrane-anchored ribosome-binding protein
MFWNRTTTRSTQELASDFNQLVDEGRALLGELAANARERAGVRTVVDDVSEKLAEFQSSATSAARRGARQGAVYARQADRYLRDNPWPAVAGGIILAALAALWLAQRR